jgi:hypothetical protein
MSTDEYEKVEVPRGTFIGWALKPGQKMEATVLTYGEADGRDFDGDACPLIVAELLKPFTNYRDKGTTVEELAAGELVSITCGLANLKRTVRTAALEPGNRFILEFTDTYKTAAGEGKAFEMKVARTKATAGVPASDLV